MKEMRKTYHAPKTRQVIPAGMHLMDDGNLNEGSQTITVGSGDKTFSADFPAGSDPFSNPDDVGAKGYGFNRYFE